MEDSEIRSWLLEIAETHLQHRPDVLGAFAKELNHKVRGIALVTSVHRSIPHEHWYGRRMNSFASLDFVGRVLLATLEGWLKENSHLFDGPTPQALGVGERAESTGQRRARRYQQCLDAGLRLPPNDYGTLPRGIGGLAEREGITRQAYAEDIKAHIRFLNKQNGR